MRAANSLPFAVVAVPSVPAERLQFALEIELSPQLMSQLAGRPAAEVERTLSELARHAAMRAAAQRAVCELAPEKERVMRTWLVQRCLLEQCLDEVDPEWEDRWCEQDGRERVPAKELAAVARAFLEELEGRPVVDRSFAARERAWDALQSLVAYETELAAISARKQGLKAVLAARKAALRDVLDALKDRERVPQPQGEPVAQAA